MEEIIILVSPQGKDQVIKCVERNQDSKILFHFISKALEYYGSSQEFLNSFTQI